MTLPQWDPIPPSRRSRLHAWLVRPARACACVLGAVIVGLIVLSASPRAPQTLQQVLPWSGWIAADSTLRSAGVTLWPDGDVPYYNAAPDQTWALDRAVRAWNESGAAVHLHAVSREQAELIVEPLTSTRCDHAEASRGRVARPRVHIFRLDAARPECNRYDGAQALAHELGHVLGLDHQTTGCATMNRAGSLRGPEHCVPTPGGTWRCRLLELSDVRRAVELYGGTVRPLTGPRACPLA